MKRNEAINRGEEYFFKTNEGDTLVSVLIAEPKFLFIVKNFVKSKT